MIRIAFFLTLIAMVPAFADEWAWYGSGDELNAELRHGTADKAETPISFWCTPDVDIVYVAYVFRPMNAAEGMEASFTLSAGDITIPVEAIGYEIAQDKSFVLEAQIPFDDRFVAFIQSDGNMIATAEGKAQSFSLGGAREASGPLLKTCGRNLR